MALERKMREGSADWLRPHHFFNSLVTRGSSVCSTHDSDRSVSESSHDSSGRIAAL